MKDKSKEFRCICGKEVKNKKKLIEHYREKHPASPINLFDALGTIGDEFADIAIKEMKNIHSIALDRADTLEKELVKTKQDYNDLVFKANQLSRGMTAISQIVTNIAEAHTATGGEVKHG